MQDSLPVLTVGFVTGVLLHGLLDWLPHSYPIPNSVDIVVSLILFAVALVLVKQQHRPLLCVCFLGAIFSDLVDLGPPMINKEFGWSLPVVRVFPWHWRRYSGSIYNGSKVFDSFLLHLLVIGISAICLYAFREALFVQKSHR